MSQRALRRCDSMLYPVHFSGLSFGAEIISDLSGRVPAGLTGLVGPNGVGKSVLLKLLAACCRRHEATSCGISPSFMLISLQPPAIPELLTHWRFPICSMPSSALNKAVHKQMIWIG